ncbi:MAG: Rdx family protein [Myxococcota bacterium]
MKLQAAGDQVGCRAAGPLGVQARLIEGSRGIFDVIADGTRVFSKHEIGRFPAPGEVADALAKQ